MGWVKSASYDDIQRQLGLLETTRDSLEQLKIMVIHLAEITGEDIEEADK